MAILNQKEYRSVRTRLAQIRAALDSNSVVNDLTSILSPEISALRRRALVSEAEKLQAEITEFEELQSTGTASHGLSANALGLVPIIARIARRMSQKDLAERLQVSEQQIQRYERERYARVNLTRYEKVLEILGIDFQSRLLDAQPAGGSVQNDKPPILTLDPSIVSEVRKHNWVSLPKGTKPDEATQILTSYVSETAELSGWIPLYRRNTNVDDATTQSALSIWQARVLQQAIHLRQKLKIKFNIVDTEWLTKLANLSTRTDGPAKARDFLLERGILLLFVPHLPHTKLDGAAVRLFDGTPVIAMTIRYDRLDSFWFTLFHEIGHILLHFHEGLDLGFTDNFDLNRDDDDREVAADLFAMSALVPDAVWATAPARFSTSSEMVRKFANTLGIHPAIIAGRIRKEREDYKVFSELLGSGLVRPMLADQFN